MGGSGPALPARDPPWSPLNLISHVFVARMGGSGPALPARGPALVSAQWNWAASVDSPMASVDAEPPEITSATTSK
jgi:hypothetical protein